RQAIYRMFRPSGEPFELDPQQALQAVLARLQQEGLSAILATEFEFYLTETATENPDGKKGFADLYSLDEINRQGPFLSLLTEYAAAQNISTGNIISEYGAGQWEVNLAHKEAMRAVLEGILLRRLVRAAAAQCGKRATFMAKPYGDSSGSGMHIHLSLWREGKNCFADETILLQAVAGVLAITNEAMAIFAPYDNSFRRFLPNSYAPCVANWGRENRSVAVRLPQAATDAEKRLEFRLCGADVNPILVAAVLLAGIDWGIRQQLTPPPAHESGTADGGEGVALCWRAALDNFANARILPQYFDERFLANFLCIKENEWRHQRAHISDYDRQFYGRVL
ncbi:MAG: glutamine synthetase family protein, partial [Proteobacteria bacterium]|nr:glutamine synthetase family protein [Pseudomonadota bacterium]